MWTYGMQQKLGSLCGVRSRELCGLKKGMQIRLFFQKVVKFKAKKKQVNGLQFGLYLCKDLKELRKKIFDYFSFHYSCPRMGLNMGIKRISSKDGDGWNDSLPWKKLEMWCGAAMMIKHRGLMALVCAFSRKFGSW